MSVSSPLSSVQLDEIEVRFQNRFGQKPDGIYLVGSHADGSATSSSDIDLVIETTIPLSKFHGQGFEFFKEVNPGKVPGSATGFGVGPGQVLIGSGPGTVPKAGLIDVFFRIPGNVRLPAVKLR